MGVELVSLQLMDDGESQAKAMHSAFNFGFVLGSQQLYPFKTMFIVGGKATHRKKL